jgi:hypothetical protein
MGFQLGRLNSSGMNSIRARPESSKPAQRDRRRGKGRCQGRMLRAGFQQGSTTCRKRATAAGGPGDITHPWYRLVA